MGLRKDLQVSLPGFASAAARPATVTRQSEKLGVVGGKNRRRGEGGASENGSESGTVLASAPVNALHALKKCPQVAPRRWFLQAGAEETGCGTGWAQGTSGGGCGSRKGFARARENASSHVTQW